MIRNSIDVATRVSPNLSTLIENRLNRAELEQAITLATIRDFVTGVLTDGSIFRDGATASFRYQ